MTQKHKGPPYYNHIYNANIEWWTQELYIRRKTNAEKKERNIQKTKGV